MTLDDPVSLKCSPMSACKSGVEGGWRTQESRQREAVKVEQRGGEDAGLKG